MNAGSSKRRPVLILAAYPDRPLYLALGCTTSDLVADPGDELLPDIQSTPQTKTGLPQPTLVKVGWRLNVGAEQVEQPRVGYVPLAVFERLVERVQRDTS